MDRKSLIARGGLPPRHPMMRPPPGRDNSKNSNSSNRRCVGGPKDFSPIAWNQHFSESKDVRINDSTSFRVYTRGTEGPVLLLLHGGGFSALSWACFSTCVTNLVKCRCAAIDLRGHGDSGRFRISSDSRVQIAECLLMVDKPSNVDLQYQPPTNHID